MRSKFLSTVALLSSSFSYAFAADCKYGICLGAIHDFIDSTNTLVVASLGTLFLALAVVGFFLGVVRFIWAQQQGEEKGIKAGKETLKWGILALFCAFSVYGIIRFGQSVLFQNPDDATKIKIPKFIIDTTATPSPYSGQSSGPTGPGQSSGPTGPGRVTGSNYTQSSSGANGSTYTGPGANTGGRSSAGACFSFKDGAMGSYVNDKCVVSPSGSGSPGNNTQANAQASFDGCRANDVDLATCQRVYTAAGGQGNALQALADSSRQQCLGAGNTSATCSTVYTSILTGGYADTPDPVQDPVINGPPANDASCYTKNNGQSCDDGSGAGTGYCEAGVCISNTANP